MTIINDRAERPRIEQVIETIRAVHEQAPDLTIRVRVEDQRKRGGWVSDLTITGDAVSESSWNPTAGPISDSGSSVGPHEDPLAIAASMVGDTRRPAFPEMVDGEPRSAFSVKPEQREVLEVVRAFLKEHKVDARIGADVVLTDVLCSLGWTDKRFARAKLEDLAEMLEDEPDDEETVNDPVSEHQAREDDHRAYHERLLAEMQGKVN